MDKKQKDNPWIEIEALEWNEKGFLMIRKRGTKELVDARRFVYLTPNPGPGGDLGPINYIGCGGPGPYPAPPNGFCTKVPAKGIRAVGNGLEVRTELGVKRLDELFQLSDDKAKR